MKRQVWTALMRRTSLITDATTFTAAANKLCNVHVVEMTSDEITRRNVTPDVEEVFHNAPVVQGIKEFKLLILVYIYTK